jgi:RNA polymerase sigma factor (sigma-70 family)
MHSLRYGARRALTRISQSRLRRRVVISAAVNDSHTTAAVQQYLDDLADVPGQSQAEPVVRLLMARAVDRLHLLCATLLHRSYPRLTHGPLNLRSEELLSAVVERLLKAMRQVRPQTVRQFFALANQHMRWELNDLARRLDDERVVARELHDSQVPAPALTPPSQDRSSSSAPPNVGLARILAAIEDLPEEEREVFNLVRIQGMTLPEAASVAGVSSKTVQRRLKRCLVLLGERLGDLRPVQTGQELG